MRSYERKICQSCRLRSSAIRPALHMNEQIFDKGVFTISLDFELLWGSFDSGKHRKFIAHFARDGGAYDATRGIIDRLLALFQNYDMRVTWATLGHLFLAHCEAQNGVKHADMPRP